LAERTKGRKAEIEVPDFAQFSAARVRFRAILPATRHGSNWPYKAIPEDVRHGIKCGIAPECIGCRAQSRGIDRFATKLRVLRVRLISKVVRNLDQILVRVPEVNGHDWTSCARPLNGTLENRYTNSSQVTDDFIDWRLRDEA